MEVPLSVRHLENFLKDGVDHGAVFSRIKALAFALPILALVEHIVRDFVGRRMRFIGDDTEA